MGKHALIKALIAGAAALGIIATGVTSASAAGPSYITHVVSGQNMTVEYYSTGAGAAIRLWRDNPATDSEKWQVEPVDGVSHLNTIRNVRSGLCLAPASGATAFGTYVRQYPCDSSLTQQQWWFRYASGSTTDFVIASYLDEDVAITTLNGGTTLGTYLVLQEYGPYYNQVWRLRNA
jgi:hypothetical protein